jgi:obg-like ATPase 1
LTNCKIKGAIDPVRDLDIINTELRLKDMSYLESAIDKAEKIAQRQSDKTKKFEFDVLTKVKECLEKEKFIRRCEWNEKEIEILNKHLFLTAKPIVYLVNLSEQDYIKKVNDS